jgi:hypothetical protein
MVFMTNILASGLGANAGRLDGRACFNCDDRGRLGYGGLGAQALGAKILQNAPHPTVLDVILPLVAIRAVYA